MTDRIIKLINKADSLGDTPEGRACLERASWLAERAGMTIDTVWAMTPPSGAIVVTGYTIGPAIWRAILASEVARYAGVRVLRASGGNLRVVGRRHRIEHLSTAPRRRV